MKRVGMALFMILMAWPLLTFASAAGDLSTMLMKRTFKIQGRNHVGQEVCGTVFIVGRPSKANPQHACYVMVTAGHILERIAGEKAEVELERSFPHQDTTRGRYGRFASNAIVDR